MRERLRTSLPEPFVNLVRYSLNLLRYFRMRMQLKSARVARKAVGQVDPHWRKRIDAVVASPDNEYIRRVKEAGQLEDYYITMHNGVKLCANGYYGKGTLNMLIENRGVHEPQEERAFEAIIGYLPEECCMLELGAYWAFYSLSLLEKRPRARCFLVEPKSANMMSGKENFRLNQRQGTFIKSMVGAKPRKWPRTISVDSVCKERAIDHLNILHADIQGHELTMLAGASHMLSKGRIDYVFISSHSDDLHHDCISELKSKGYSILAEADLTETCSYDGLIVAKHTNVTQPKQIRISKPGQDDA